MKKNRTIRWPGTIWPQEIGKMMKLVVVIFLTLGGLSVSARYIRFERVYGDGTFSGYTATDRFVFRL